MCGQHQPGASCRCDIRTRVSIGLLFLNLAACSHGTDLLEYRIRSIASRNGPLSLCITAIALLTLPSAGHNPPGLLLLAAQTVSKDFSSSRSLLLGVPTCTIGLSISRLFYLTGALCSKSRIGRPPGRRALPTSDKVFRVYGLLNSLW
jgi:hypothetical protein